MKRIILILPALLLTIVACGNQTIEATADEPQQVVTVEGVEQEPMGDATKANHIIISKETMTLTLYDSDSLVVCRFPIAVGKNLGNKQRRGDMKTPEGLFSIEQIQNSSTWCHDFGDGKGMIAGCYGNWFLRLKTPPHKGIGIHGTHDPASIGTRATEGCIRLENSNLDSLKPLVHIGMAVRIESSVADRNADGIVEEVPQLAQTSGEPRRIGAPMEQSVEVAAEVVAEVVTPAAESEHAVAAIPEPQVDEEVEWYTIKDGDLISRIAYQYGTTISEIKRLNPELNVDRISIGQRIRIRGTARVEERSAAVETTPTPTPVAEGDDEVWYTIQDGDLISRIAQRHGTTSRRIAELNPDINIDRISIGQRIRIK